VIYSSFFFSFDESVYAVNIIGSYLLILMRVWVFLIIDAFPVSLGIGFKIVFLLEELQ